MSHLSGKGTQACDLADVTVEPFMRRLMTRHLFDAPSIAHPPEPVAQPEVEALIQRLAERAVRQPHQEIDAPAGALRKEGDDVILDLQVGDIRCILMRRALPLPRAEVSLSPREQEIARMVARGYANKTIAAVLDISSWTVGTHLRRIFAKVGVSSRAAMVARLLDESSRHS